MKLIFTLILAGILCHATNAQLVLNEVYTDPGSGKNEFFELYNPDPFPEQTDNYTLVTYYKTTTQKGLYVLDLPAATIASKGYFVGSSATPFNYQGVTNSTNSSFSWNDPAYLAANGGSLTRWQVNNGVDTDPTDGNPDYNFNKVVSTNDFFVRSPGSGTSFITFLFKNGTLVNSALLGSGGSGTIDADVLSLPPLFVDMQGSSPDFTIDFSSFSNLPVEDVNQEAGSDNGFIRKFDGSCSSWTKSSSQVTHTPLVSNGQIPASATGSVTVNGSIIIGDETAGSTLSYNVSSVPGNLFPLQLNIYIDKGNQYGQLDAQDSLLKTQTITSAGSNYTVNFKPFDRNIIIVVKTGAGCVDNTKLIQSMFMSTLPIRLLHFTLSYQQNKPVFGWAVANNEDGNYYELESSADGAKFQSSAIVTTTAKNGWESYSYKESKEVNDRIYYRLKMVDKQNVITYSNVLRVSNKADKENSIQLLQNPVASQLVFSSNVEQDKKASITIYNLMGSKIYSSAALLKKGINYTTVNLEGNVAPGSYLLEVTTDQQRNTVKFIKH